MEDPYPIENIDRLGVLMFQTSDNSQLLRRVLWINAELTIVSSLKHKNTQPIYIFNRENSQNSESPNGPRRGLDFIALVKSVDALSWPAILHSAKIKVTWNNFVWQCFCFCLAFSSSFIFVYIPNSFFIDCPVETWEENILLTMIFL